ncbi:uncharacterized protein METZ01_LOCUS73655 [marine metagenome]|uniref:DUF5615 domain-containing protein n=1 Tax=marine metagenome TaxID=408172 RepID=A0A381TZB2_9ZZZZ|tara:strand:+ start:4198 stop:4665 length:468 start_codon:yes stop_codon:yes gene_type:complete
MCNERLFMMGTLSSEFKSCLHAITEQPRIYADANVTASLVAFMRDRLRWDVFFVIEHDDLRRASDQEHYRVARGLLRTLITFERDFLEDKKFPPSEGGGVVVISWPDQRTLRHLLRSLDRNIFGGPMQNERRKVLSMSTIPLEVRKLNVSPGWHE